MNKFKVAVLAVALAFAGAANAGFYCKLQDNVCGNLEISKHKAECDIRTGNSYANEHVLEWHSGVAFPDVSKFNYTNHDVVCFADNYIEFAIIPQIGGIPHLKTVEANTVAPFVGAVYRGDSARFLIDNLRSVQRDVFGAIIPSATPVDRVEFTNNVKP